MSLQNTQNLVTDFCRDNTPSVILKQYDKDSRFIIVRCTENGVFKKLDNKSMDCKIKVLTPDNRAIYKGSDVCEILDDGTIKVSITEGMVYTAGVARAELNVIDNSTNAQLSPMTFNMIVKPSPYGDDRVIDSDEFSALTELINKASKDYTYITKEAKKSADAAKVSETNAKKSEKNAKSSETNAALSASKAKTSETNAKASEDNAKISENNANTYMENASNSASAASGSATEAESYARGGTGSREGEDTDNAKYYYEKAKNTEIGKVSEEVAGLNNDISVLSARLDNIASLPEGSTTADAELQDIRVGSDGRTYNTAGEAVREQVGELKGDLDSVDLVLTPRLVENSGYFYNDDNGANIQSDANFCYTDPIEVKKGDVVELVGVGYNTSVSMICLCDANNSHRMSVYYSSNSSVNTYRYTATMDCYLTFSYKQTSKHSLKIYRKSKPIVIDDVVNESPCAIETIKTVIDLNGTLTSHPNYCISSLIQLKRNDELKFSISCENTASALSLCNSSGSFVKSLIAGKGQSQMEYSYTATEDCYVKICFRVKYRERTYSAELNHFRYEPIVKMSFSMFEKWGVIGDSFASGVFYDNEMQALDNHLQKSWAQILARKCGNNCVNFSMGGLYCATWLSNNDRGLPFLLRETPKELYIVALGINDVSRLSSVQPLGSMADINNDFSQNPNTFYGNYGKIIGNIKSHAPKAKIIMSTIPYTFSDAMIVNNAIIAIAEHYELPCLMVHADKFFRSEYYWDNFEQDHPKSFMYGATANAYERLICDSLKNDTSYWGDTFN